MIPKPRREAKLICGPDLSAVALTTILVVLTLLLGAMIILGHPHHDGMAVDLPRVRHPKVLGGLTWGANKSDAMHATITKDGRIIFANDFLYGEVLPAQIRACVSHGSERRLYIRVDAQARYGAVKDILEAAQSAGVEDVSFLADQTRVLPAGK